jgi:hypothetical protein
MHKPIVMLLILAAGSVCHHSQSLHKPQLDVVITISLSGGNFSCNATQSKLLPIFEFLTITTTVQRLCLAYRPDEGKCMAHRYRNRGASEAPRGRREGGRMDGRDNLEKHGAGGTSIKLRSAPLKSYQFELSQS